MMQRLFFAKYKASEVLEKVKAYEEYKEQNNIIRVGDEVRLSDDTIGIVVYSSPTGHINIFTAHGSVRCSTNTKAKNR